MLDMIDVKVPIMIGDTVCNTVAITRYNMGFSTFCAGRMATNIISSSSGEMLLYSSIQLCKISHALVKTKISEASMLHDTAHKFIGQ